MRVRGSEGDAQVLEHKTTQEARCDWQRLLDYPHLRHLSSNRFVHMLVPLVQIGEVLNVHAQVLLHIGGGGLWNVRYLEAHPAGIVRK